MRAVGIFLGVAVTVLVVAGGVYAWKNNINPLEKLGLHLGKKGTDLAETPPNGLGEILGATKDAASSVQETVGRTVQPVTDIVSQTVGKAISLSTVGKDGEKIPVDQAIEQVKQQAVGIPEAVFEKARYDYCRQVVEDYKKKSP